MLINTIITWTRLLFIIIKQFVTIKILKPHVVEKQPAIAIIFLLRPLNKMTEDFYFNDKCIFEWIS